jgi:hypothetical protein
MLKCNICNKEKNEDEYDLNGNTRRKYCKECRRKKNRKGTISTTLFKKGMIPWNKGKKCESPWNKGKKLSLEIRRKLSDAHKGKKLTLKHRKKLQQAQVKRWEHTKSERKRYDASHKKWSRQVKERDGNKCTICGTKKRLHAHHKISWKEDESLRLDISNGQTLCSICHAKLEGFPKGHTIWNKGKIFPGLVNSGCFKKGLIPWNKKP